MNSIYIRHIKRMVKAVAFLPFYFFTLLPLSCVDVTEHEDTPEGNFEALWRVIDEHYCFFDYKQQVYGVYGLDWNAVYNIYNVRAKGPMNDYQLFEVLTDMLSELKDGHVLLR